MNPNDIANIFALVSYIGAASLVVSITMYFIYRVNDKNTDNELRPFQDERKEIHERLKEASSKNTVDTIKLELNQLAEYYVINKGQARNSFRAGQTLIAIGFITITFSIWSFFLEHSPNFTLSAISTISGVLLQFIGGASFLVYRKSLEQLNHFFNQLIRMQDIMLAVQLTQELPDPGKQLELMGTIINALVERSSNIEVSAVTNTETRKPSSNHLQSTDHHSTASQTRDSKV